MLEILDKICEGRGTLADISFLEDIAQQVKIGSLCGLGATAPNPVQTALKYFRDEFEEHVVEKKCRSGSCAALTTYTIDPVNCTGCRACARVCPVQAISGERKEVHVIDQELCIKCGACFDKCRFDAVRRS
jgi:ferredoxin